MPPTVTFLSRWPSSLKGTWTSPSVAWRLTVKLFTSSLEATFSCRRAAVRRATRSMRSSSISWPEATKRYNTGIHKDWYINSLSLWIPPGKTQSYIKLPSAPNAHDVQREFRTPNIQYWILLWWTAAGANNRGPKTRSLVVKLIETLTQTATSLFFCVTNNNCNQHCSGRTCINNNTWTQL